VDNSNLTFFGECVKSNDCIGGRPACDYLSLFKVALYARHCSISTKQLHKYHTLGSEFRFLSNGMDKLPVPSVFSKLYSIVDKHIDEIFHSMFDVMAKIGINIDVKTLYCDGTVFETHNSRHKVVTRKNVDKSMKKWTKVLTNPSSTDDEKQLAEEKMKFWTSFIVSG
jgi:transposase